jgi:hypothetical protein
MAGLHYRAFCSFGRFGTKADAAEMHADQLRRISFALWTGEFNQ